LKKAEELGGVASGWIFLALASCCQAMGKDGESSEAIEKARPLALKSGDPYIRACLAAVEGDSEKALRLLEEMIEKIPGNKNRARYEICLANLRGAPRFKELVRE
jgi:hypothetical protein